MRIPITVTGVGVDLTPDQVKQVREAVRRLRHYFNRIVAAGAVVTVPHRWPSGEPIGWALRLTLAIPGGPLVVSRQEELTLETALDETMQAARRQLEDRARLLRGDVKVPRREAVRPLRRPA